MTRISLQDVSLLKYFRLFISYTISKFKLYFILYVIIVIDDDEEASLILKNILNEDVKILGIDCEAINEMSRFGILSLLQVI